MRSDPHFVKKQSVQVKSLELWSNVIAEQKWSLRCVRILNILDLTSWILLMFCLFFTFQNQCTFKESFCLSCFLPLTVSIINFQTWFWSPIRGHFYHGRGVSNTVLFQDFLREYINSNRFLVIQIAIPFITTCIFSQTPLYFP